MQAPWGSGLHRACSAVERRTRPPPWSPRSRACPPRRRAATRRRRWSVGGGWRGRRRRLRCRGVRWARRWTRSFWTSSPGRLRKKKKVTRRMKMWRRMKTRKKMRRVTVTVTVTKMTKRARGETGGRWGSGTRRTRTTVCVDDTSAVHRAARRAVESATDTDSHRRLTARLRTHRLSAYPRRAALGGRMTRLRAPRRRVGPPPLAGSLRAAGRGIGTRACALPKVGMEVPSNDGPVGGASDAEGVARVGVLDPRVHLQWIPYRSLDAETRADRVD